MNSTTESTIATEAKRRFTGLTSIGALSARIDTAHCGCHARGSQNEAIMAAPSYADGERPFFLPQVGSHDGIARREQGDADFLEADIATNERIKRLVHRLFGRKADEDFPRPSGRIECFHFTEFIVCEHAGCDRKRRLYVGLHVDADAGLGLAGDESDRYPVLMRDRRRNSRREHRCTSIVGENGRRVDVE